MLKPKYLWHPQVEGIIPNQRIYSVILQNRGIDDPDHFFSMGWETLHDPLLIHDMSKAVERVRKAIDLQEKIVIFGDYDADGITAISVLYRALHRLGANVEYDLPDRFVDGYGLNMRAAQKMIDESVGLVITVDNGITCLEEAALLKAGDVDLIVTDHHSFKEVLPDAYAIVHPKLSPDYPFQEIAGVMVAYKLASAISESKLEDLTDLVMIGTIADLMPLENENQAMVNLGLLQMKKTQNLGLKKLIEFSSLDLINETAIAFKIAPKINSSGRLGKAKEAVRLLTSTSEREVNDLILDIEQNHMNRKDLTEEAFVLCEKLVNPDDNVLVISSPFLHEGVIGICAQKIAEKYQKSTIVITVDDEGIGKGSMRSFGGDNILTMLDKNKEYLLKFGGHSQAAGLQIEQENIEKLRASLQGFSSHVDQPILQLDMEVKLEDLKIPTIKKLQDNSFFTALFLFRNLRVVKKSKLSGKHTKLSVESGGLVVDCLHFNSLEYFYRLEPGDIIDVVGGLNINEWRNRQSIQIMLKDLACDHFQVLDFRSTADFTDGQPWIRPDSVAMSDDTLRDYPIEQWVQEASSQTVILIPRQSPEAFRVVLDKDTYGKVFRSISEGNETSLYEIAQMTGLDTWTIKKVVEVFLELDFLEKGPEGFLRRLAPKKRELHDSVAYEWLIHQSKTADWLYSADIRELQKTFHSWTEVSS